jgi:hypothetical protein
VRRDPAEVHGFEMSLARIVPGLTVTGRVISVRTVKQIGRLLDEHGRTVGAVPMDLWSNPLCATHI